MGKTNLLDAIHYLCFTKSYFTRDGISVQQGMQGFRVEGEMEINDRSERVVCILRETGKKEFTVDDIPYEKFAKHIGRYPCVIIAPDDIQIITGGSEQRRRFLDALISQLDAGYLQQLITYNRILVQRNSLLKGFAGDSTKNLSLLDVLDEQLSDPGEKIAAKRKEFLQSFLPLVQHHYSTIAGVGEKVNLFYQSELMQSAFDEILKYVRKRDLTAQRSTSGIHRDELVLQLDNEHFRNVASQGQRKSLLFALKLAEMTALKESKGFAPLLLLDDVFEKLDEDRIIKLLEWVCIENDSQVFITDTNPERLGSHLERYAPGFHHIRLGQYP